LQADNKELPGRGDNRGTEVLPKLQYLYSEFSIFGIPVKQGAE
jgi:hypothetical protein